MSSPFYGVYSDKKYKHILQWREQFDAMAMTESEIGELLRVFNKIDTDKSGIIDTLELLMVNIK